MTRVCDVTFRDNMRIMSHDNPNLHNASSVEITFGSQKTEIKDETISQDNNGRPLDELNPVPLYAEIVRRIRSYPGFKDTWEICTFFDGRTFTKISSQEILRDLRTSVSMIGEDVLGLKAEDVGTHSIRGSLAMWMYLAKVPIYTIMLQCRWASDAFLYYIEKQVREFSKGLSSKILENEVFFNIPTTSRNQNDTTTENHNQSHHRRANLNIYGRQGGSLRHQLRPRG